MTSNAPTLLSDFSVEMTGKDVDALHDARAALPQGTRVNVTFLGNENLEMRLAAARAVLQDGFVPVPHISARRIASASELEGILGALQTDGASRNVFAVAGDPPQPMGPYEGALALIQQAPFERFGVERVSIAGYPEGHPDIDESTLWSALTGKATALAEQGRGGDIITQFGFDVDPVVRWIEAVREHGIDLPIRIGVPGPAGVKRLLSYAKRFGVASSAGIAKKYGFSLTNLLATAGPDRFLLELAGRLDPAQHGTIKLHFYAFGGLKTTAEWIRDFADRQGEPAAVGA
jgi:methylenetetrahydrofolate reductase (NADPH)